MSFFSAARVRAGLKKSVLIGLVVAMAACGSDESSDSTSAAQATSTATTPATDVSPVTDETIAAVSSTAPNTTVAVEPVTCAGDPVKFWTIETETGPLSIQYEQTRHGIEAAVQAVNETCAAGRPIQVTVCDDKSDPNESAACGRQAAEDGAIAMVGSLGQLGEGADAANQAGVPLVMTPGTGQTELSSPTSFPASSIFTTLLMTITGAKSGGADSYLFVAFDSPIWSFVTSQAEPLAAALGVKFDTLFFPADTSDFAPLAAQIAAQNPDAIGFAVPASVPFLNGLAAEGISPFDILEFTAVAALPPQRIRDLEKNAEGVILMTANVPPTATDNPGIAQFLVELEAAGYDPADEDLDVGAPMGWSAVHVVADVLATMDPSTPVTSASFIEALVSFGPIDRPEMAAVDFSKPAFTATDAAPALAAMRIFGRTAMATRVTDGVREPVTGFVDALTPFTFES
jgi:ABC-type branched-subunit amino acid transport system substrate-binding protein